MKGDEVRTLADICEEYIDSMYRVLCDGDSQADWKRVELHQELFVFLGISPPRSFELNRILHSLNVHIGFPISEYGPGRDEQRNVKKYGRLLAKLLREKFEPEEPDEQVPQ